MNNNFFCKKLFFYLSYSFLAQAKYLSSLFRRQEQPIWQFYG